MVHDARIFRNRLLFDQGQILCEQNRHFLGDCAYAIKPWLLVPYRDTGHLTNTQKIITGNCQKNGIHRTGILDVEGTI